MKRFALLVLLTFGCSFSAGDAPREAEKWAAQMYPGKVTHTSCSGRDSDRDGYASCVVVVEGLADPVPIECGTGLYCHGGGCKLQMPKLRR